jgi:hypothetical protein
MAGPPKEVIPSLRKDINSRDSAGVGRGEGWEGGGGLIITFLLVALFNVYVKPLM